MRFLGLLEPAEVRAALARAAFVVAPSRWDEPCPYSVIEAMAAGVPVLASRRGGLPEMVGEEHTLPDRDVASLGAGDAGALERPATLRRARGRESLERARATCSGPSASMPR